MLIGQLQQEKGNHQAAADVYRRAVAGLLLQLLVDRYWYRVDVVLV